jgi:putative peptidoglycan lipid II flippase
MSTDKSDASGAISGQGPDSQRSIIKSTSLLSVGTLSSRIFGFLRDMILAKLLGTGAQADAFFVALKIPNLLRDFIGEGATNSAVVPVFAEHLQKEKRESFWQFVSIVLVLAFIILSIITILGILLAPVIVRAIAPGFIADPNKLLLTIRLTRVLFPYLIFIGLTAYCMGILFTFRSFLVPAFSPCLLNIAVIISALIAFRTMDEPVFGLAIGVLVGGLLQLVVQIRPILKTGVRFEKPKTLRHPGAAQIGKLLIPRMVGSGVYQLTVLIDTFCASLATIVGQGGISAIYYSNRIIQFPMGIFSFALASAVLPSLSGLASKKDTESIKKTVIFALENIFFVMAPTTVMLLLFAHPVIRILFERGEFTPYSTDITSFALAFYALGLFSFGGIKILVTVFHALQDTKTPVKVAMYCLGLNAALNFILMGPLKIGGIALASSIAGTVDFLALFYIMNKQLGKFNSGLLVYFLKVTLAALFMGIAVNMLWVYWGFSDGLIKLLTVGTAGFLFYGCVCVVLGIEQARKTVEWIRSMIRRT